MSVGCWTSYWARISPDHPALVFQDDTWTYDEFDGWVNRASHDLLERGVQPGDRVAALLTNRPEFLVTVLACAKIGAIFVPLNVRLVARELAYLLSDAEPRLLITESAFDVVIAELNTSATVVYVDDFARTGPDFAPLVPKGDGPLAICYTSGTTGLPKGAVLTHENVVHGSVQEIVGFGFSQRHRHLVCVPLCFTGGLVTASLPVFHSGGTVYLEVGFDPEATMQRIGEHRITHMMGVPTIFGAMAQLPGFAEADFSSVELFLVGGAPVPAALVDAYQSRGASGFTNAFGLTEGTGFNMFLPPADVRDRAGAYLPALYSDVRLGDDGELLISGPCVMAGYWRNDEATAAAIQDGWLHTGDLVHRDDDGYFRPIDRLKDMIISGGLNIYPAEIEGIVFEHPSLIDSTVIGLPEAKWGEAVTVVAVAREEISAADVIGFCADKLADYKRPKDVIFVDELPRNTGGKVLKRELRERFVEHYAARA